MEKLTPEQEELAAKLTKLQRLTVLGVVSGKSQRQAYYDAGGKSANDETADAVVSRMLSDSKVRAFYDSLLDGLAGSAILTRREALERLSLISRTRITDVLDFETVEVETIGKDGEPETKTETIWRMKDSAEMQEIAASAIKSVTMTKFGPKIEMYDATAAIAQISKMQGWDAAQKVVHGGDPDNPVVTAELDAEAYRKIRQDMLNGDDC